MARTLGSRLAIVVAHPDDDAYGGAGSVALHARDPGFRFVLVHATDGGAGDIADRFPATRETLGALRREECAAAWRAVGRSPDRHDWLGYPDGALDTVDFGSLVDRICSVLADERPDVVLTFGADGITGHPDHITVGRATDEAFHRVRSPGHPGLRRLVHGALPQSALDRLNHRRRTAGLQPWDPDQLYDLRGVPD